MAELQNEQIALILAAIKEKFPKEEPLLLPRIRIGKMGDNQMAVVSPPEPILAGTVYTTYLVRLQDNKPIEVHKFRARRREDGTDDTITY